MWFVCLYVEREWCVCGMCVCLYGVWVVCLCLLMWCVCMWGACGVSVCGLCLWSVGGVFVRRRLKGSPLFRACLPSR